MIVSKMSRISLVFTLALAVVACKDRDAEKRIAYLESKLAAMEGKKKDSATTPIQPVAEAKEEVKPEGPLPVAQFSTLDHNFGTIKEGESVEHTYVVKNTGEAPLLIQGVQASCGCTAPDWTKTPIAPGATGFVKAKFDSSGKPGAQNKTITVTANTYPKQTVLRFRASVTPKSNGEDGPVK